MLPLVTGLLRAKEMLLTGAKISAADALAWGLANRVLPKDAVLTAALSTAQKIAAQPQQSVRDTKRAINAYAAGAMGAALRMAAISERQSFPVIGLDGR